MKIIIVGLGNFGSNLGLQLMEEGHEVIGVDNSLSHIELLKDKLTYTICADTSDESSMQRIPFTEADYIIISIGEDLGASIITTALIKKHCDTKIIARAISPVHYTILETMNVFEIVQPEVSFAKDLAERLSLKGALKTLFLDNKFEVVEVEVPRGIIGKKVIELELRQKYNINIVTIIRQIETRNFLGKVVKRRRVAGVLGPDTEIGYDDILVLFGNKKDIERMINDSLDASGEEF